jgi:hypothetical protein
LENTLISQLCFFDIPVAHGSCVGEVGLALVVFFILCALQAAARAHWLILPMMATIGT